MTISPTGEPMHEEIVPTPRIDRIVKVAEARAPMAAMAHQDRIDSHGKQPIDGGAHVGASASTCVKPDHRDIACVRGALARSPR